MFGNIHPTYIKISQVALEMKSLMQDADEHFGKGVCALFKDRFGVDLTEGVFRTRWSYWRQTQFLVLQLIEEFMITKTAYVGVHAVTGELMVISSDKSSYPGYLPDMEVDVVLVNQEGVDEVAWAARTALEQLVAR